MDMRTNEAVRSLVRVRFPGRNMALTYYNDRFSLRVGDLVHVDGELEGIPGRVEEVCLNFKIRPSEYKRIVAVADTEVHGELHMAGSRFVSFHRDTIPYEKVLSWFKAPDAEGPFVTGSDGTSFPLEDLSGLQVRPAIAERGQDYYAEDRVLYLCLDGTKGRALVDGTKVYEGEFTLRDGEVSELLCDCPCAFHCKHEVAALLQLRETLEKLREHCPGLWEEHGYFAAVFKPTLYLYALVGRDSGRIIL